MRITVADFYEAGRASLRLSIECGDHFEERVIEEPSMNRPGLALAGFFQYFAGRRIQVLGLAEFAYLRGLSSDEQQVRLDRLLEVQMPVVMLARNRHAGQALRAAAQRHGVPILRSPLITSHLINAATVILEALTAPRTRFQGTMVDINGLGVLIEGAPGVGKSEIALTLIEHGHSLVSDDITELVRANDDSIIGTSLELTRYHMEIRGLGIDHVPSIFGVAAVRDSMQLDLIVRLKPWSIGEDQGDWLGQKPVARDIHGVAIPVITLPVSPGRDMAHVIEVAALNRKLVSLGHDAVKELDARLVGRMHRKGRAS